jgi:hypothetical protein
LQFLHPMLIHKQLVVVHLDYKGIY